MEWKKFFGESEKTKSVAPKEEAPFEAPRSIETRDELVEYLAEVLKRTGYVFDYREKDAASVGLIADKQERMIARDKRDRALARLLDEMDSLEENEVLAPNFFSKRSITEKTQLASAVIENLAAKSVN